MQNKQDECGDVGRGGTITTITLQQTTYQQHQKVTIHKVSNTILYTNTHRQKYYAQSKDHLTSSHLNQV